MNNQGYNERLFHKGVRAHIHLSRFAWLRKMTTIHGDNKPLRVLELGCYDGRSIDWLPSQPLLYDGFDANWEGGLDIGRVRYAGHSNIRFHECSSPEEMVVDTDEYDLGISLETIEHIPPAIVDGYLQIISRSVTTIVFFTVPNETGLPFLIKYIAKKVLYRDSKDEEYTIAEFWNELLGRTTNVHRNEHKGFNYRLFIKQLENYFHVDHVMGIPIGWLPASLSFTIGIVARPKTF